MYFWLQACCAQEMRSVYCSQGLYSDRNLMPLQHPSVLGDRIPIFRAGRTKLPLLPVFLPDQLQGVCTF